MAKKKTVAGTPADPTVRFVKVDLDSETYSLCYDFSAIATAEAHDAGVNLLSALSLQGMTARQFRAMFFASLLKAQPEITIDEAGALMVPANIGKISAALGEAWIAAFPDPDPNPPQPDADPASN